MDYFSNNMSNIVSPHFVGPPCGNYTTYTFYKGFRFFKHGKFKTLKLGEFFFVKIYPNYDPCIGELELLWLNQNSNQLFSSIRLYFLPEQTPEGRLASHGEDEVLVASDKVVLRLEDLVGWITDQVDWAHGLLAYCDEDVKDPIPTEEPQTPISNDSTLSEHQEVPETSTNDKSAETVPPWTENTTEDNISKTSDDALVELSQKSTEDPAPDKEASEQKPSTNGDATGSSPEPLSPAVNKETLVEPQDAIDKDELRVLILSYSSYCRYRTIQKRLGALAIEWLKHTMVIALGGFAHCGRNTHVLFCRDTFEHEDLGHHELNCEYLAPTLKIKKHKKKGKNGRSNSPGSDSNTSDDCKEILVEKQNVGFKQPPCKTEQEFLQRLYRFMKQRKTPIHRVPHLGFKQIDLFVFFSFAQKLGGYDKITGKRLWKHVYDELGGDPGSTSAATCTRRHYEKLLLPFERFMDGKEYKPKQTRKKQQKQPIKKPKDENSAEISDKGADEINGKTEMDDAYAFTDSNHENSKDSGNEELNSSEDMQLMCNDGYSDEDCKSIWSIQKSADLGDFSEKEESKQIKPLIIHKEQNESFSEKERQWNEIRRRNALARKWVRQLRPSRGNKASGNDKLSEAEGTNQSDSIKDEMISSPHHIDLKKPVPNSSLFPMLNNHNTKIEVDSSEMKPDVKPHMHLKPSFHGSSHGSCLNGKEMPPGSHQHFREHFSQKMMGEHGKSEPVNSHDAKSWHGYTKKSMYQYVPEKMPYATNFDTKFMHNLIKQELLLKKQASDKEHQMKNNQLSVRSESNTEGKPNLSQRRPSVIQHTEYITSSSPSQSPKQLGPEGLASDAAGSRDAPSTFITSSMVSASTDSHLPYTMTSKVQEWLAKGMHEAIACKTPSSTMDKSGELHDKVMMPSSCKTPGPGSSKVPLLPNKTKAEQYGYSSSSSKPSTSKSTVGYHQHLPVVDTSKAHSSYSNKLNSTYQRTTFQHHTMVSNSRPDAKYLQPPSHHHHHYPHQSSFNSTANIRQSKDPFYNQPKRQKVTSLPAVVPPRPPSLVPFSCKQTYRTSPLSDIPKTMRSQNDCESMVLDLSMKSKPPEKHVAKQVTLNHLPMDTGMDPVCLDLTVKKKSNVTLRQENAIENITPPPPQSPKTSAHQSSYSLPRTMKPLPTLIALHDLIREEARSRPSSSAKPTNSAAVGSAHTTLMTSAIPLSSLNMPPNTAMYAGNAQCKIPSNFLTPQQEAAFAKEMAKSLYMHPDPTQFPPYVIPSFYGANWPTVAGNLPTTSPSSNHTTTSPNSFKDSVNHCVFPKQYLYNYKQPFHPILHKDNSYPPNCK